MGGALALIGLGVNLGLPILRQMFTSKKAGQWFDVLEAANNGSQSAIAAVRDLDEFQKSGKTPTDEELDEIFARSQSVHDQVQATAKN